MNNLGLMKACLPTDGLARYNDELIARSDVVVRVVYNDNY